jgi:signal transduction histidine kinase
MPNSTQAFKARVQIDLSFIIAGCSLLGSIILLFYQHNKEEEDNEWVVHTYQVIDQLKAIEALLVDAETGTRGYVATGDTVFLQPYKQAMPRLSKNLRTLPKLVADNPSQEQQVKVLNKMAQAKVSVVKQLARSKPSSESHRLLALGKQRMDAVRRQASKMIAIEQDLMKKRTLRAKTAYQNTNALTGLLFVIAVLALVQAYRLIQRELKRRLEAQGKARHTTELLQTVVNNAPTGIVLYQAIRDADNKIIDFTRSLSNSVNDRTTSRAQDELLSQSLLEMFPANRSNGYFDSLARVVETGQPVRQLLHYEAHGIKGWFDTQCIKQDDGVLVTYLDVTDLKEAQIAQQQQSQALEAANRELQRSNASLQSFAYIASHDLQEPLRKIESFGNLLQEECQDQFNEKGLDYLNRMRSAARRMSLLIKDLLAYSRLSSAPPVLKPISVSELVTDILDDLELAHKRAGVEIAVGELPTILGDSTQLRQLLQNLISNAIKFSSKSSGDKQAQVQIRSRSLLGSELPIPAFNAAGQRFWEISVQDNGIGFDTKYLDRIFEVFQRLNSKQQFSGSGIGLAICKRVVENHNGYITATSHPGEGATFLVYLPA